jgi:hypothetical protein
MARKRKNAGQGYGMTFHGAFGDKASAKKKERQVHGFIKPTTIKGERRYVVMSERKNPIKRKRANPKDYTLTKFGSGRYMWSIDDDAAERLGIKYNNRYGEAYDRKSAMSMVRQALKGEDVRGNPKNPSELVVLGANPPHPSHKEIVLDPHTTYTIRTNPSAEAIREDFTGMPAEHYTTYNVEGMPAGDYAELGQLLSLYVKPVIGGQVREIRFTSPKPVLASDTSRRQLYFVGGDQDISDGLEYFSVDGRVERDGLVELGECRRIDYKQRKEQFGHPEIDEWKHNFGEETGVKPILWFDPRLKQLFLKGGEYEVRSEGITN